MFLLAERKSAVYAQYYSIDLENPNQTINAGDTFNVKVYINTENVEAINGDVLLDFDPDKISIESAASDNFFLFDAYFRFQ